MTLPIYPSTLPDPASEFPFAPIERRKKSSDYFPEYRQFEKSLRGKIQFKFIFTAAQAATFRAWWATDLINGGSWFTAIWPFPWGRVASRCKFVRGSMEWTSLGFEAFQISCELWVTRPLPAAAIPTDFLLDTFTGTGDLASRSGEIGASWSLLYGGSLVGLYGLDGAGNLVITSGSGDSLLASGSPTTDDFYLELTGTISGTPLSLGYMSIYALDNGNDYFGGEFNIYTSDFDAVNFNLPAHKYWAHIDVYGTAENQGNVPWLDIGAFGVEHTIRMEITNSRKTYTAKLDGTTIGTYTMSVAPPTMTVFGCTSSQPVGGTCSISRVAGGPL